MSYQVRFSHSAARQFQKLNNKKLKERIALSLEHLAANPLAGKPLQAEFKGCYSCRVGDYRIIYVIYKEQSSMGIIRIEHRREVYR